MLTEITYYMIFGMPLIAYLGTITLVSLLLTASISVMNKRGIRLIPFRWHPRMAAVTIMLALVHGILGMLSFI